jgi:oligopeptidase B
MRKNILYPCLLMVFLIAGCAVKTVKYQSDFPEPPKPEKINKELTMHGQTRVDPYYWLNERENPKVLDYLRAENKYLDTVMSDTKAMQEEIFNELVGRIKQDDETVPYLENGYYYYNRFEKGMEYPVYCRKKGSLDAAEEILINVNDLARGFSYFNVGGLAVSPDNNLLAYSIDTVSRRKYEIRLKNLLTGAELTDRIPETTGSVAWASDNKTFFYTRTNTVTLRSEKIFRHTLASSPETDPLVFFESDETYGTGIFRSKSGKYLIIACGSTLSTEYRILDAGNPEGQFAVFEPRQRNHEYSIDHFGDHFYIRTNWDAPNFKLMKTALDKTARDQWTDVIPHRADVLLEGFELFDSYLVAEERIKGLTQLRIMDVVDQKEHYLDFGEETYTASISVNREFSTNLLRFSFSSLTTPGSTFDYNMATREKTLLKQQEVLGGFDPANYESKRLYAKARDGVQVPVSLVYRKGLELDGKNPCLLYSYGSYGISSNPSFSSDRLSLLDRGFVFAIAHIRGGQEMGRQWYEDGKLLRKKNTFTDFIDAGEYLVQLGYTSPDRLCAMGGSAGGLLMGAVLNMKPDLFRAVVAHVPFVDVVTTMLDTSIPLTTAEYDEWGNPNIREYYDYMLSYSPYDQVKPQNYPAILVTTGLHDSQVQYFEPAKWVARLRETKTDDNILLLKINMEAGHGGVSGRFQRYRETSLVYAFLFNQVEVEAVDILK